jgi:hypothetical protein
MHPLIESSENDKTTAWDTQLRLYRNNLTILLFSSSHGFKPGHAKLHHSIFFRA